MKTLLGKFVIGNYIDITNYELPVVSEILKEYNQLPSSIDNIYIVIGIDRVLYFMRLARLFWYKFYSIQHHNINHSEIYRGVARIIYHDHLLRSSILILYINL